MIPSRSVASCLAEGGLASVHREDVEAEAALNAYQREFEEDHSWEQLREDEFGRLVALVRRHLPSA